MLDDTGNVIETLLEEVSALQDEIIRLRSQEPLEFVLFDMYDRGLMSRNSVILRGNILPTDFYTKANYYRRLRAEGV